MDRWRCTPAGLVASLYRSVDLCEPKARVRERCLGRTYCAGGAWRPSVSRVRHASGCGDGPVARSVSGVSVSETVPLVPVRAASGEPGCVCVCFRSFTVLVPHTPHARGERKTTYHLPSVSLSFYLSKTSRWRAAWACRSRPVRRADVRCELLLYAQPLGAQHAAQLVRLQLRGLLRSKRRQRRGK